MKTHDNSTIAAIKQILDTAIHRSADKSKSSRGTWRLGGSAQAPANEPVFLPADDQKQFGPKVAHSSANKSAKTTTILLFFFKRCQKLANEEIGEISRKAACFLGFAASM